MIINIIDILFCVSYLRHINIIPNKKQHGIKISRKKTRKRHDGRKNIAYKKMIIALKRTAESSARIGPIRLLYFRIKSNGAEIKWTNESSLVFNNVIKF